MSGFKNNAHIYDYATQVKSLCKRIREKHTCLKLVLKTKNNAFFLERWIQHHLKIVGDQNLIIFDNMSSDPAVFDVYRRYASQIIIIHYKQYHLLLHNPNEFYYFYKALYESSDFYAFLDVDEFLYLFDGKQLIND